MFRDPSPRYPFPYWVLSYKPPSPPHPLNLIVVRLPEDQLDYKTHPPLGATQKLPASIDLRSGMPPVYNQGSLGSCTANALCAIVQYDKPSLQGSRLFLYYNERVLINSVNFDSGAYLHDGVRTLSTFGVCSETSWPYVISQYTVRPPDPCYQEALNTRIRSAQNIRNDLNSMKLSLYNNEPFVVGILVYQSFMTTRSNGMVPMPNPSRERLMGGHAIVCCGYDDKRQVWIMRNSWGTGWGDGGYFYLPYAYLTNPRLSSDLWNVQTIV